MAIVICPGAEANWCEWWIANMQRPAWHRQRELRRLELAGRRTRCLAPIWAPCLLASIWRRTGCLAPIRAPYRSFSTTICIAESVSRRAVRLSERCHRLSPPNSGRSELLIGPIANHHSLSTVMLDLDGWLHEQQTFFWSAWMNETTKHWTTDLLIRPRLDATTASQCSIAKSHPKLILESRLYSQERRTVINAIGRKRASEGGFTGNPGVLA